MEWQTGSKTYLPARSGSGKASFCFYQRSSLCRSCVQAVHVHIITEKQLIRN